MHVGNTMKPILRKFSNEITFTVSEQGQWGSFTTDDFSDHFRRATYICIFIRKTSDHFEKE